MAYTSWEVLGREGKSFTYEVTITANGAVTFPMEQITGEYLMYVKYAGNASGSFTLTMVDGDGVDYLEGGGVITGSQYGFIRNPTDRMLMDQTITPTIASLTTITSLKLTFFVEQS